MNIHEVETWLKTTIPGIVLLGAAGSVLAVWLCKAFGPVCVRALRWPFVAHVNKVTFQAFTLGYSHALIERDRTGRLLTTFLAYHLARLIIILAFGLGGWMAFLQFAYTQGHPVLTLSSYFGILAVFLAIYGAFFELEYIHRTFRSHWGGSLEGMEQKYQEAKATNFKDDDNEPPPDHKVY